MTAQTSTRTFGETIELPARFERHLALRFCTGHLALRWTHCSATANFLSAYYGGLFRASLTAAQTTDLTHSIAYLANELLENAVKFRTDGDVELATGLHVGEFVIRTSNHVTAETGAKFQAVLADLTAGDPGELLLQRIEANAADETSSGSGLGILTLMNDYGVRFCWTFTAAEGSDKPIRLQTIARLPLPSSDA